MHKYIGGRAKAAHARPGRKSGHVGTAGWARTAYEEDEPNWPLNDWQLGDRVTYQTHNQRQVPRMLVYL